MRSYQAALLLLLLGCGRPAGTRAQEDDDDGPGTEAQDVDAVSPTNSLSVEDGNNDVAVAGIWQSDLLFVAMQTTGFLGANLNFGEEGTNDIYIQSLDEDLESVDGIQIGGDGDDLVWGIAGNTNVQGNFAIVGSTYSEEDHLFASQVNGTGLDINWFIATMDTDLNVIESYVNGTEFEGQEARAVTLDASEAGTYYVAGRCWGDYFEENAGSDNEPTADDDDALQTIGYDAWVVKITSLDIEDALDWSIQFGTVAYDTPTAIVAGGSAVYVVGTISDDSEVLTAAEQAETPSMFVVALDTDDGDVLWEMDETTLGVLTDASQAHGAVLNEDGTELFVSGHTEGVLPDYDGDETEGAELFVMSIDTDDGTVNWVWQSESNATAFGTGGIVLADDGVSPIVSGIAFGNQFNLTFDYWQDGSGDMIAAKIDPDDLEVTKYFVAAAASTETREQPNAMVKDPDVEDGVFLIGQQDGDFTDEDAEIEEDDDGETLNNFLILKVELTEFPEEEEEDDGRDFPYWPWVGVPVFAIGGILFLVAYKWAAASQAAKAKQATMV